MAVKVNTEAIAGSAQRIRAINRQLRESYAEVDAAVARLSREWNGKAAEEAEAAIRGVRSRHVDSRFDAVEKLADFLEERVAEGYRKTEEKRKTAAAEFR